MNKQRIIVLAAAGLGIISCLLPWAKVQVFFFASSVSGLGVWSGWLAFLGFILAGIFALLGDDKSKPVDEGKRKFILIGGIVAFLFTLLTMVIWSTGDGSEFTSLKLGIYISLLMGVALAAIPFVVKDNGDFEMPTKESFKEEFNEMKDDIVDDVKDLKDDVVDSIDGKDKK